MSQMYVQKLVEPELHTFIVSDGEKFRYLFAIKGIYGQKVSRKVSDGDVFSYIPMLNEGQGKIEVFHDKSGGVAEKVVLQLGKGKDKVYYKPGMYSGEKYKIDVERIFVVPAESIERYVKKYGDADLSRLEELAVEKYNRTVEKGLDLFGKEVYMIIVGRGNFRKSKRICLH